MPAWMDFSAYRPGQHAAHLVIYERVQHDEPYTTIVLPTRYGKTDVIRGTAIHLFRDGLLGCALTLSPGVVLRDQVVDTQKWQHFVRRYRVDMAGIRYRSLPAKHYTPQVNFASNGEMFVSVSTHLVDSNVAFFQRWVEAMRHRTGKRVVVYIDEAHTGSEDNSWGATVQHLVQAGAQAVLLTATPTRSDGKRIPGFPCEELDRQDTRHYVSRAHEDPARLYVDQYEATDRVWRLVPHHVTSFREAWDESVIAAVSRFPFDVRLEEVGFDGDGEHGTLSALSAEKTRRFLDRLCRHPKVMRAGIRLFVEQLRVLRRLAPACAGIIFCGNDKGEGDAETNAHANSLARLIHELEPTLQVIVATAANPQDEAELRIKHFARETEPVGDVLIVKQMAGRGIDIERLKVILDLSPIRAEAAWVQRIMRAATLYHSLPAIYITPDDRGSRELFERLVATQGGEISTREVGDLLQTYDVERRERPTTGVYVNGIDNSDFQDTDGREGYSTTQELVRLLVRNHPAFLDANTHAGLSEEITSAGFTVQPPQHVMRDTTAELDEEREVANTTARLIAGLRLQGRPYSPAAYQTTIIQVWRDAYQAVGVTPGLSLGQIADVACLQRLSRILAEMEVRERGRHGTHRP